MGPAIDQLERPPGATESLEGKGRSAAGKEARAAEDAGRPVHESSAQNCGAGESCGIDHARAGGFARRRALETERTRSPAARLRAMLAGLGLPSTLDSHRHSVALATARPRGRRRHADATGSNRQLL